MRIHYFINRLHNRGLIGVIDIYIAVSINSSARRHDLRIRILDHWIRFHRFRLL